MKKRSMCRVMIVSRGPVSKCHLVRALSAHKEYLYSLSWGRSTAAPAEISIDEVAIYC